MGKTVVSNEPVLMAGLSKSARILLNVEGDPNGFIRSPISPYQHAYARIGDGPGYYFCASPTVSLMPEEEMMEILADAISKGSIKIPEKSGIKSGQDIALIPDGSASENHRTFIIELESVGA